MYIIKLYPLYLHYNCIKIIISLEIRDLQKPYTKRRYVFSWGGEEGWGILGFFSQKSVGPPLRFNENTPDPPPLGD